ncbi:MAG: hypothetical protein KJP25_09445 [Gammaproteobacteria bacterium]|nr:hypothetical protein [Gammaproteobacteria bacterium]MBT8149884.1 hypothetical protein [Gammaproteobacteria bacterium]NND38841.1 hypothetical protein [Pseudomonadales bacterium]NNL11046.1 hypothetical protein [Pseudomonadales bacterium]NNM10410.1 hypothetical protein [Pseudomonadales bacterium]
MKLFSLNLLKKSCLGSAILAAPLLMSGPAFAQTALSVDSEPSEKNPGVEIVRPVEDLADIVRPHPVDRDFINTALVLTDAGGRGSVTYCVAYNQRGDAIGRGFSKVPGNGVRVVFASDLSNGVDFLGKIRCKSRDRVSGTAYIVGADFSDTRVHNLHDRAGSVISVPVVISR